MANTVQQIKRYKKDNVLRKTNASYKSALKTSIKKVLAAIEAGDKEAAEAAMSACSKKIDASVSKGIHHKNWANNQKSRLQKKVNAL
ncbi:MAG: 30S ribosomal protein S20 [Erysipelotrichaceae bacterium]|nr:30S ribosomal protein S20 [Erysipelotrichaceae bacterium]